MTLPASGTISLSQVNTELGSASNTAISLNQASVRGLFGKASGIISLADGYGKSNAFTFGITTTIGSSNLRTLALSAGWDGTSAVVCNMSASGRVVPGVNQDGLYVSGPFPGGVTLNIANGGGCLGGGGIGGQGRYASGGDNGNVGMTGLVVSTPLFLNNAGSIGAGGGGGGGGGGAQHTDLTYRQGGNGGNGDTLLGVVNQGGAGQNIGDGSIAGSGGNGSNVGTGSNGTAGSGTLNSWPGGQGAASGYAIIGSSYITWIGNTGSIYGPIA